MDVRVVLWVMSPGEDPWVRHTPQGFSWAMGGALTSSNQSYHPRTCLISELISD